MAGGDGFEAQRRRLGLGLEPKFAEGEAEGVQPPMSERRDPSQVPLDIFSSNLEAKPESPTTPVWPRPHAG